jgi:excisionase family DNA binding protein
MNTTDAAKFLGKSERAVQRYAAQHRLSVRYVPGDGSRSVADYDEEELKKLKEELAQQPPARPAVAAAEPPPETGLQLAPDRRAGSLAELLEQLQEASEKITGDAPRVAVESKVFLTRREACALAGVGPARLAAAIRAGELSARKGLGRGDRIKRADLEKWAEKL